MKIVRVTMLGLALGLASSQAYALVDVSAFGGYAMVGMGDVNGVVDSAPSGAGITKNHVTSGYYVGADAGITVLPFLKVGPRIKLVKPNQASIDTPSGNATIDSSLMLYEVGVTADTSLPLTGLSVIGGVWGGYGMANASVNSGPFGGGTNTGSGGAFSGEVAAQLRYKLVAGLSIGVDLAYLLADIKTVNQSNGSSLLTTNSGAGAAFDYSGLNAGGALSWDF